MDRARGRCCRELNAAFFVLIEQQATEDLLSDDLVNALPPSRLTDAPAEMCVYSALDGAVKTEDRRVSTAGY